MNFQDNSINRGLLVVLLLVAAACVYWWCDNSGAVSPIAQTSLPAPGRTVSDVSSQEATPGIQQTVPANSPIQQLPLASSRQHRDVANTPTACISFEQFLQTPEFQKDKQWLDSLGGGIFWDIAFGNRESRLAPYLDYAPEKLATLILQGDTSAKLVQAYIHYEKVRKLAIEPANDEQVLGLMREARKLWWDAVIDGGNTVALVSMGQSYYLEKEILQRQGKLSYAKQVELEKLSYRYGEAAEALIEGLDESFYTFDEMMAPVDDLQAALDETIAMIEAERASRGLPSLHIKIPPEREWIMAQDICDE